MEGKLSKLGFLLYGSFKPGGLFEAGPLVENTMKELRLRLFLPTKIFLLQKKRGNPLGQIFANEGRGQLKWGGLLKIFFSLLIRVGGAFKGGGGKMGFEFSLICFYKAHVICVSL